ncbi:leukocyte cysteine proteinase inhibitor 1-like [Lithobates pipiens]
MSGDGKSEDLIFGGWSEPDSPSLQDHTILHKVKKQYLEKSGTNPEQFLAVLVRTQVVAGTNYLFKVDVGGDIYSHLRVFNPLPCRHKEPDLECFQLNKTKDDELEIF